MKKLIVLVLIIGMLVVSGCGPEQEPITPTTQPKKATQQPREEVVVEAPPEEPEERITQVSYELTSEERAKVESKIATEKVVLSTHSKIMSPGDVYVFAIGINNVYPRTTKYRIVPTFEKAMAMVGGLANRMPADDNTMLGWLAKNRFEIIELEMAEHIIVPLIVEVGQYKAPGDSVVTGSYTFDIEVQIEESPQFWKSYDEKSHTVTIRLP